MRTVLVSDIHVDLRADMEALGAGGLLHAYVLSYEHGVQKPDPAIFRLGLEAAGVEAGDGLAQVRRLLRDQLRERVDARGLASAPRTERRVRVREEALGLLRASGAILPQRELTRMVNEVSDEVVGFGPIEFLLKDPDVTEVTWEK